VSNAPGKPVSFSRPKVGYFSNRPRTVRGQVDCCPGVFTVRGQVDYYPGVSTVRGQVDCCPGVCTVRGQVDYSPGVSTVRGQVDCCPGVSTVRGQTLTVRYSRRNRSELAEMSGFELEWHVTFSDKYVP
jgi:hypothetical protein